MLHYLTNGDTIKNEAAPKVLFHFTAASFLVAGRSVTGNQLIALISLRVFGANTIVRLTPGTTYNLTSWSFIWASINSLGSINLAMLNPVSSYT